MIIKIGTYSVTSDTARDKVLNTISTNSNYKEIIFTTEDTDDGNYRIIFSIDSKDIPYFEEYYQTLLDETMYKLKISIICYFNGFLDGWNNATAHYHKL